MTNEQEIAERCVEQMWADDAASRWLGMRLVNVLPGSATVEMTVTAHMVNGFELCHGGFISALADTAFAAACNSRGRITVASGFDITFLEPGRLGDDLRAEAAEVATRGRSGLYDVTVRRAVDQQVIAEFRGRSRQTNRTNPAIVDHCPRPGC